MRVTGTSHFPYTIRNYRPADFHEYLLLHTKAEKLEPTGRCLSPEVIAENLGRPGYPPELNLFIAELAGNIVGYMDVAPELILRRVILDCWIHPRHRRRGLATELLGYARCRAKELGFRVAHINVMEDNAVARSVLFRLGFKCVRQFLELKLDVADFGWPGIDQVVAGCRRLQHGEEDQLTQIQNRAFAGTWGYSPNTTDEITYRVNLGTGSPEDVILSCDGDKVIGYCWTGMTCEGEAISGTKGRIFMLGVDPDYRDRGVGKRVLLAGLVYLKNRGLQLVKLTVDSENKLACALYESVGFKVHASSFWYEKAID